MATASEKESTTQSYDDMRNTLEARIGVHTGRISHVRELPELEGQKVWLVTAPIDNRDGKFISLGTSFLIHYTVGTVINNDGKVFNKDNVGDLPLNKFPKQSFFLSDGVRKWTDKGVEMRCIISLKDYNVLPLGQTNSALFKTEDDARKYQLWLKMRFESMPSLEMMDPRCLCAKMVDLEKIKKEGFTDYYKK